MNTFNRVFVIVTLVVLLVLGAFTLITPAGLLSLVRTLADFFRGTVFAGYSDTGRVLVRVVLAIIWIALMGFLLWLEVRRPGSRSIEIARYTGASAIRISTAAVQEKVKEQVDAIGGVIESKVNATGRNRAVELNLDVAVTRDVDLVAKAEEIAAVTRQVVQDQLGLKLAGKPQVAIKAKAGKPIQSVQAQPAVESRPPYPIEEPPIEEPVIPSRTSTDATDAPDNNDSHRHG